LRRLAGFKDFLDQDIAHLARQRCKQGAGLAVQVIDAEAEAKAELSGVLEERVGPGRTTALRVARVRRRWQVATVDRRAAGGIGDQQAVAEKLRQELEVRRLAAAATGPGILEQRQQELRPLDLAPADPLARRVRDAEEEVIVGPLRLQHGAERRHV